MDRACILLAGRGTVRGPPRDSLPSSLWPDPLEDLPNVDALLELLTEVLVQVTGYTQFTPIPGSLLFKFIVSTTLLVKCTDICADCAPS